MNKSWSAPILATLTALSLYLLGGIPTVGDTKAEAMQPAHEVPRKPMIMDEPMAGEMKKEGMKKEAVMKGAIEKDKAMKEILKNEESTMEGKNKQESPTQ